jgi:nucleoside-triphosphatase
MENITNQYNTQTDTKELVSPNGKYRVNLKDLEEIGTKAITEATEKVDVIAIDEIGPMELYLQKFKQAVKQALESKKLVLAVVHSKAQDPLITQAKEREDAEIFSVTISNRDSLPQLLTSQATATFNR